MPKLGSKKSRTGCKRCKERRVKCDEGHPRCGACTKYDLLCEFTQKDSNNADTAQNSNARTAQTTRTASIPYPHAAGSPSDSITAVTIPNQSLLLLADAATSVKDTKAAQCYTLLHLELLHYFLTKAIPTVEKPLTVEVWRDVIPRLAYDRAWLMNGMIAVGALQRAHDEPSIADQCITVAMDSLNSGLPVLHSWVHNPDDPEGAMAIVAFASVVSIYSMALLAVQHRRKPPDDAVAALVNVFDLIRGTAYIFELTWSIVQTGPLRPFTQIEIFADIDTTRIPCAPTARRRQTLEHMQDIGRILIAHAQDDPENIEQCRGAYDGLNRIMFNMLMSREHIPSHEILAWPATLTVEFRRLIRDQYPPAVTLLTYFSLCLRDDCWYTKGWRFWTVEAVGRLPLSAPWQPFVQWAKDQVKAEAEFLDVKEA